jgi:two-component system LytT family response regulator
MPLVIFVTAYDQYAIKAFEIHAFDYLLKPFKDERLKDALNRAKASITQNKAAQAKEQIEKLADEYVKTHHSKGENFILETQDANDERGPRLIFKSDGKVYFINPGEIVMIEAFDYYIKIHVQDRFYLVRDRMKKMEELLDSDIFKRVHKSYIINCRYLNEILPLGNNEYHLVLHGKAPIKSGRSFSKIIQDLMQKG